MAVHPNFKMLLCIALLFAYFMQIHASIPFHLGDQSMSVCHEGSNHTDHEQESPDHTHEGHKCICACVHAHFALPNSAAPFISNLLALRVITPTQAFIPEDIQVAINHPPQLS